MDATTSALGGLLSWERVFDVVRAVTVLGATGLLVWVVDRRLRRAAEGSAHAQQVLVLRRALGALLVGLGLAIALNQLGFRLTALLGAAGVLTVALGFAAQTSVSNVISGLFLLGERPFSVGDAVTVGDTTGEVIAIDLLSVKLRTPDNLRVRIPNETVLKAQVTTLTAFPIRRLDVTVGVAYEEDPARVRDVLLAVADENPLCLAEPAPLYVFLGFGESSLDLQFSVWSARENYLQIRNSIYSEVKQAFDEEGIELPFPHRTLYAGSATEPFPVRVVDADSLTPPGQA